MNRIMFVFAVVFTMLFAHADTHWFRTDGGAIDLADNWYNSVKPDGSTTGLTWLHYDQNEPLTMPTESSMSIGTVYFSAFDGIIALGSKSKTLNVSDMHVGRDALNSASVELASGTIAASGNLYFDGAMSSFLLNGPNAEMRSSQVQIGIGQRGCSLAVIGGSKYTASDRIYVGIGATGVASNSLVVSGSGSLCIAKAVWIGAAASNSFVKVVDGGRLEAASEAICLGREYDFGTAVGKPRPGNVLVVSNATMITRSGSLVVGMYSSSNRLEILDRSVVEVATTFRVGYRRHDSWTSTDASYRSYGNSAAVRGVGTLLTVGGEASVGDQYCADSSLLIADGATATFNDAVWIGREGSSPGATFSIDNAVFDYAPSSAQDFHVGYAARDTTLSVVNGGRFFATNSTATLKVGCQDVLSASNCLIRVASGGVLKAKTLNMGNVASGVVEVENGDMEFSGTLWLWQYATLSVKGTNSYVHAHRLEFICPKGRSSFTVDVPPEGLDGTRPLIHADYLQANTMDSSAVLAVNVAEPADCVTGKRTYIILKRDNGTSASDVFAHTTLAGYDRASLDYDNTSGEIRLTVLPKKKGFWLVFR